MTAISEVTPFARAAERVRDGADHRSEAAALVGVMTLAEKLDCLDGDTDFWPGLTDMVSGGYMKHPWPAAVVERLGVELAELEDLHAVLTRINVAALAAGALDSELDR